VTDVLRVNGSTRVASAAIGAPIEIALDAAPAGPNPGRYTLWVWSDPPVISSELTVRGESLGCTANPTPLARGLGPQPFRCLRGERIPPAVCRGVREIAGAPATAPWTVAKARGFSRALVLTLQGLLEDDGSAATAAKFSVTNGVIIDVR
jgi:hypothetical protein